MGCTECGGGDMYADSGMDGGHMMAGGPGCANGHCNLAARRLASSTAQGPPGPAAATVTYPYYTNRGPRDFLARNPGNIGP